jgi:uncharacterized membrane protein
MASDLDQQLARWTQAGLIDSAAADRIRAFEVEQRRGQGMEWQIKLLLIFGAIFVFAGIILFFAAHWENIGPLPRMTLALTLIALLHLAGGAVAARFPYLSTSLHAIATLSCAAAIAIIGQAFNLDGNWPGAVVLWALCAIAGWIILRDPVQQTIALLLIPAAIISEWIYYSSGYRGGSFLLRLIGSAAILLLLYAARSSSKFITAAVGTASTIALLIALLAINSVTLSDFEGNHTPLTWPLAASEWLCFCILPLAIAFLWNRRLTLVPVLAIVLSLITLAHIHSWNSPALNNENPLAYLWNAFLAAFLVWWGVHRISRTLINFGMALFAVNALMFFFSNIFDKLGRSASFLVAGLVLIGGGILMERFRRRILRSLDANSGQGSSQVLL